MDSIRDIGEDSYMKHICRIAGSSGLLLAAISLILGIDAAHAADYPTKSVRMIVAFAPGGASDLGARILAQKLTQPLGQQVVVDNRAGAGGNLGHELAAKATPDGYTILWCSIGPMAVNVS